MTGSENALTIIAGKNKEFKMKIPVEKNISWREPPKIEEEQNVDVYSSKLAFVVDQVQFCISQDSPVIMGPLLIFIKIN